MKTDIFKHLHCTVQTLFYDVLEFPFCLEGKFLYSCSSYTLCFVSWSRGNTVEIDLTGI